MLRFFKRRRPVSIVDTDSPLAIRDLLEQPALRALMADDTDGCETVASPTWRRLAAAGPIRFDVTTAAAAVVGNRVGVDTVADIAA